MLNYKQMSVVIFIRYNHWLLHIAPHHEGRPHDFSINLAGGRRNFHIHCENEPCTDTHLACLSGLRASVPLALGISMAVAFDDAKVW